MSQLTSEALQLRLEVTEEDLNTTLTQLTQLKVPQLKELCKSIGLTQKGKKQELIDRLHQFISSCSRAIERGSLLLAARTIVLKALNNDPIPNFSNLCSVLSTGLIDQQLINGQITRLQNTLSSTSGQRKSYQSHSSQVVNSNVRSTHGTQLSAYYPKYQGPMLLFQSTLFYTLRRMVHGFPYVMVASMGRNVCNVPVHLDKDEISALQQSSTAKIYFFCALSSTPNPNRTDLQFPPIEIYVDGVNTKQYVKGLKGKAGTCRPADLTSYIKDINRQFTINIVYSDAAEPYIVYLYVVDSRTPEDITRMVVDSPNFIPSSLTKGAIRKEYELNQDDDIIMATSSISLRCPLSYARMTYPVKSIQCDHIQCFDALSFLSMQERIPSWICPVCSAKINQQLLALSKYMEEILHATSDEVDTVTLNPDGSWVVAEEGAEDTTKPSVQSYLRPADEASAPPAEPNTVDDAIEIISLGSDSEDEQEEVTISAAPPEPTSTNTSFAIRTFHQEDPLPVNTSFMIRTQAEYPKSTADPITLNDESTVMETEVIESTPPPLNVQVQQAIMLHQDNSMVHSSANVSSDDEPIQNYSRRRHHTIEESATYSDSSLSHSALNERTLGGGASTKTNEVAVASTMQLAIAPIHIEGSYVVNSSSILSELLAPNQGTETDASSKHSSDINDLLLAQTESVNALNATTSNVRDTLVINEKGDNHTTLVQNPSTVSGVGVPMRGNTATTANTEENTQGSLPLDPRNGNHIFGDNSRSQNTREMLNQSSLNSNPNNINRSLELPRETQVPTPNGDSHNSWMSLMINPEAEVRNTQGGSIINTIQNMFSRSTSPHLATAQPNGVSADSQKGRKEVQQEVQQEVQKEAQKGTSDHVSQQQPPPQQITSHAASPAHKPRYADLTSSSERVQGSNGCNLIIGTVAQPGFQIPKASETLRSRDAFGSQTMSFNAEYANGGGQPSPNGGNLLNGNPTISKAEAYRKTVKDTSQLISLYRQMEGKNNKDPMESYSERRAWMGTDGTISFAPTLQASTSLPNPASNQSPSTSSWNASTNLTLNESEARTRSVPTISTQSQNWPANGIVSAGSDTAGARYSRSPFDAFREAEQEKQTVRGILGIEVAHDVILPWNSPSGTASGKSTGGNEGHPTQNMVTRGPSQMSAGSRLLYNLPTLNRTSSIPVLTGADDSISSPLGKKRSISGSSQPEKSWNKRLNKQKFDPSEIGEGQVIELDD